MWKFGIIAEKGVFVCRARTAGIPLFTPLGGFFFGGGGGGGERGAEGGWLLQYKLLRHADV